MAFATVAFSAFAEDQPTPPAPPEGRPNFEQMRQRWTEQLKTSLKVTDQEWAVLQPLVEKVQTAQRESMFGRFGRFGGGPGGPRRGGDNAPADRPQPPGQAESDALRKTLENDSATPDEIKAKLAAVRDAHKKGAASLEEARNELRKVVTLRQEATLVSMGLLD